MVSAIILRWTQMQRRASPNITPHSSESEEENISNHAGNDDPHPMLP